MNSRVLLFLTLSVLFVGCGKSEETESFSSPDEFATCGDSICDDSESCASCPEDCGQCSEDGSCGDSVCDDDEDCLSCPDDCGECSSEDVCGDEVCSESESCSTCSEDCGACIESSCGDGQCTGVETCETCPEDCGQCEISCGDGACNGTENCLTCAGDCGVCASGSLDVWSPRPIAPQFALRGGTFQAEVHGDATWNENEWYAMVSNSFRTWPCTVKKAKHGDINYGRKKGWTLDIQLPHDVPPELLKLSIAHGSAGTGSRVRSVQVLLSFEESFYVIHQTDHHIASEKAKNPDGTAKVGNLSPGTSEALTWGAKSINIINPRFVILTGDNTFVIFDDADSWRGLENSKEILRQFRQGLETYQVATMATTGNHDVGYPRHNSEKQQEFLQEYANILGPRAFSRRLGSFYVGMHEWSRAQSTEAMTKDFEASFQDPLIQFRLVGSHYHTGDNQIPTQKRPAGLQLVGHIHQHKCIQSNGFLKVAGPQAKSYQRSRLVRFNKKTNGWGSPLINDCEKNKKLFNLHGDNGSEKLTEVFLKLNDGTQTSNQVTITNRLAFNFNHGRATFVMAKGTYKVTAGQIEAAYDSQDTSKTVVLVRVNIPAKNDSGPGKVVVKIEPQ